MTVDDFCRCTPLELSTVYESWSECEQRRERAAWERTRLQCTTMLQPYSRNRLRPQDVLCFEWDGSTGQATSGEEKLSAKEIWKRFEEAKKEMGC